MSTSREIAGTPEVATPTLLEPAPVPTEHETAAPSPDTPGQDEVIPEAPDDAAGMAGTVSENDRREVTGSLLRRLHETSCEQEQKRLRDEIVVLNMGVARAIALRYRGRGISEDDLLQAAYVGLVKAAQGFDPSFERDFLSYAVPTVTGEVKRYFRDFGWTVRPPRRVQELQAQISRTSAELVQKLDRSPRPKEVAEQLGVDEDSVIEALAADGAFTPASLDVPVGEDGNTSLAEMLGSDDPDLGRAEARMMLAPAVRKLKDRDRRILELRFFHGWTQDKIAAEIGVTQMQVSRLLARILRDLRGELG